VRVLRPSAAGRTSRIVLSCPNVSQSTHDNVEYLYLDTYRMNTYFEHVSDPEKKGEAC